MHARSAHRRRPYPRTLVPPPIPNALRWILCAADLLERDPEDTFFHFVDGIRREAEARGDPCKVRKEMGVVRGYTGYRDGFGSYVD